MSLKIDDLLAYLAIKEKGDWNHIYSTLMSLKEIDEKEIVNTLKKMKCHYVSILNKDYYPECLRNIYHPPFVLFYYGNVELLKSCQNFQQLGVIGSRQNTEYGARMTKKLVEGVADKYLIVSGLAKGIDSIAAEAAIEAGGKTIGVLGSGINICYPTENYDLYKRMCKEQLVISEYPEGVTPSIEKFPLRNRIIAGLSQSVLVTEAGNISGTSITVTLALQMGRNIMCVPYPAGENSACNRLIKEGAFLVETPEDIFEAIGR